MNVSEARSEKVIPLSSVWDAVARSEDKSHFEVRSVKLHSATDELVVQIEEPIGQCPGCDSVTIGTTAWNSAHGREFACNNDGCGVSRFENEVAPSDVGSE